MKTDMIEHMIKLAGVHTEGHGVDEATAQLTALTRLAALVQTADGGDGPLVVALVNAEEALANCDSLLERASQIYDEQHVTFAAGEVDTALADARAAMEAMNNGSH